MFAYVNVFEAVRIVSRLIPDCEALASKMTDEWITEGYWRWLSDAYDDDPDSLMVRMYGPAWRSMRPSAKSLTRGKSLSASSSKPARRSPCRRSRG